MNRTLEPLGIAKINGETIATASTLKNYLICLHTEEATGSIPVSPTTSSSSLSQKFSVFIELLELSHAWTESGRSATLQSVE
jgi:hypothetical protein